MIRSPSVRFVIMGALNTLLTYIAYLALTIIVHYQVAYAISYAFGIVFSYGANTRYVFLKSRRTLSNFTAYIFNYLFIYLVSSLSCHLLVQELGVNKEIAPLLAIALIFPLNYFLSRLVIQRIRL